MSKSKQELIQEAVKVFDGELPDNAKGVILSTETNSVWGAGRFQVWDGTLLEFVDLMDTCSTSDAWKWVCSREEFELATKPDTTVDWYGNSFPPAGTRCEVLWHGEWVPTFIVGFDDDGDIVFTTPLEDTLYACGTFPDEFRPLRTEAERKRDEIIDKINEHDHNVDSSDLERIIDILLEEDLIVD